MIEAYEIGIKLALQDGVSEGIAAIRRDLGSLDMAIAQTTLRLSQLQRLGAQALAVSQEQPERAVSSLPARRPVSVVTAPPALEPEPVAPAIETRAFTPTPASLPRPAAGLPAVLAAPQTPVGEPVPVSPTVVVRPVTAVSEIATRSPAVVVDAVHAPSGPRALEQTLAASFANAVPPAPPLAAPAVVKPVAPALQDGSSTPRREERTAELVRSKPAGSISPVPVNAAVAPQQTSAEPGRRDRARLATHGHDEVREIHVRQTAAASDRPAARMAPTQARSTAVLSPMASAAPAAPSYAPPAASPRSKETTIRGDVFFDGARVGRWMSEQMARDAGRPNTGPTGFDPRRSPAWPGAAVTW